MALVVILHTLRYSVFEALQTKSKVRDSLNLVGKSVAQRFLSNTMETSIMNSESKVDDFDAGVVWEDFMWVGSLHSARDLDGMQRRNITSVLTTARALPVSLPEEYLYKCVNMNDHPGEDLLGKLNEAFEFLDKVRAADRRVLVHCAAGVSRSVSVCIAYVMSRRNWTLKAALEYIRLGRSFINPNIGFMIQLREFEAAGCNIDDARKRYVSRLAGEPITTSLISWRNAANEIHRSVDELENIIHASDEYSDRRDEESRLVSLINAAEVTADKCMADRVTEVICRSAITKANRLLELIKGRSVPSAPATILDEPSLVTS